MCLWERFCENLCAHFGSVVVVDAEFFPFNLLLHEEVLDVNMFAPVVQFGVVADFDAALVFLKDEG